MYVLTYVCMYVFMYACVYVCVYACMYVRTYVRMYLLFNRVNFGVFSPVRKSRRTQVPATSQGSGVVNGSISSRDVHTQPSVASNTGRKQPCVK